MIMRTIGVLALLVFGCDDGGGGGSDGGAGGGGGVPTPIEGNAETLVFSATYDQMNALVDGAGFGGASFGDPTVFIASMATAPSEPGLLASLWYETDRLEDVVGRVRDRRTGLTADDNVGSRTTQRIGLALTLGPEAMGDARGGARWQGQTVVRSLDQAFLLMAYSGLGERSAAGFDRTLGLLWSESGTPHGLGAVIAAADAACGTTHLADIAATLAAVRDPFVAELAASGLPDSLGRLVIEPGAVPEYDAAADTVEGHLTAGLGLAFLKLMDGDIDAGTQAAALAAFEGIGARVRASGVAGVDGIGALLDASDAGSVDAGEVRRLVSEALGVTCGS
jgi:hypothetical protein